MQPLLSSRNVRRPNGLPPETRQTLTERDNVLAQDKAPPQTPGVPPEQTTQPIGDRVGMMANPGQRAAGQQATGGQQAGYQQINNRFGHQPVSSRDVTAQTPDAVTQQVQDPQLMRNQMNSLLDWDSPYMARARQSGIDQASSRGLGNSSIAAGNAMGAAIDRAAPIAQFDANRYGSVADQNMQAMNQTQMANADRAAQVAMTNADRDFNAQTFNARDRLEWDSFRHGQNMDVWRNTLQGQSINAQTFSNMHNAYFGAISQIYNNPNLSAEDQNAMVENLRTMFPGFANDAWNAIPQGLFDPRAVQMAQTMPPMPDFDVGG